MEQPLKNLRVLDFTRVLAGPFATQILGDLGAEIIKVEPLQGDEARSWPPVYDSGESAYFCMLNRNKKAITLNLKTEQGKEIAVQLARKADVVIENFTPGVVKKLGIDYDSLSKINPQLVYCSISGFGQLGPYKNKKAYDPILQGLTGLMSVTGEKDRPPVKVGIPITDMMAALYAVISIQSALLYRHETKKGQYIDVALYDSVISLMTVMAAEYLVTGKAPGRYGLDHAHRVPARAFEAGDGKYVQVAATNDVMYAKFCQVLDVPELIDDPRFDSNIKRVQNREIIMPILEERMRSKDSEEWIELFEEAGLPCGVILDMDEVFHDSHLSERNMLLEVDHPVAGLIELLGFPYKFSLTNPEIKKRPPLLGEHNESILAELLDYNRQSIEDLKNNKVI